MSAHCQFDILRCRLFNRGLIAQGVEITKTILAKPKTAHREQVEIGQQALESRH